MNKIIKKILKKRLDNRKWTLAEDFPSVLWAYQMIEKISIGETLFVLPFEVEAMELAKIMFIIPRSK